MALFVYSPLVVTAGAQGQLTSQQENVVEEYVYNMQLDVTRVISSTDTSNAYDIVPAHITYEDSDGQKRIVEYQVQGNGCINGWTFLDLRADFRRIVP